MNTDGSDEIAACAICARDVTLRESLRDSIQDCRSWFADHPCSGGDCFPAADNIKQMLAEGCDFASVVLDCSGDDRVIPAYANLRCLCERLKFAVILLFSDGAGWEFRSMAGHQRILDRKLQSSAPADREEVKRLLESLRQWNRQPDENGKPTSLRRPEFYEIKQSDDVHLFSRELDYFYSFFRELDDAYSRYVHPTYRGELSVGRGFAKGEVGVLIRQAHVCLCTILNLACEMDSITRE